MKTTVQILEALESCTGEGSRGEKLDILELNRKNALLISVFSLVFDPYINFFVKKTKKVAPTSRPRDDDEVLSDWLDALRRCSRHEIVGNSAKSLLEDLLSSMTELQQKWCTRVLLRNLRCGVNEGTLEKVWPGMVKTFKVALAETLKTAFEPDVGLIVKGHVSYPVWAEPKLDGLRCIVMKRAGEVTMFTRNGNVIDTLPSIAREIAKSKVDDVVLDGEVFTKDWNLSASVMMSKKNKKNDDDMVFNVFDVVPLNDWTSQRVTAPHAARNAELVKLCRSSFLDAKHVELVDGHIVNDEKELLQFYAERMNEGYEGVMLKDMGAPYVFGRSEAIVKVKAFTTYEGVVVGWYGGRPGSRHEHGLGGFDVLLSNGVITRVGNGYDDSFRSEAMIDPESYVGRIMEVQAQPDPLTKDGLTVDGKMRFPVHKRWRDSRDVDPKVMLAYKAWKGDRR